MAVTGHLLEKRKSLHFYTKAKDMPDINMLVDWTFGSPSANNQVKAPVIFVYRVQKNG
jgi:hypothetical protein